MLGRAMVALNMRLLAPGMRLAPQAARSGCAAPLCAPRSAFAGASAPLLAPGGARRGAFGRPSGGAARAAKGAKRADKGSSAADDVPTSKDPRRAALDKVLAEIDSQFGKGSIMRLGDAAGVKVDTFSSGSLTLDMALGGGLPKGRIIEIYGPESSGKTTLALHAMAAMQRKGGTVALIDAEHAFDPVYAASLGLNAREMILTQPDSGEMALEVVDRLVRSSSVDVIAVDSVAALVPQAEIEGEIGLVQVGSQARLMSQALRKLAANANRGQCTIIFLNQLRSKIGVIYGSPEVTSGGNALKFYASVRLDIRKIAQIPDKQAEAQTGIRCKVKVVKNKVAPPYRVAEFDIMFGSGISHLGCVVDAAEATGVLVRKGSWYSYKETNLGQGREKTMAALAEDPSLAAEVEAAVRASGMPEPAADDEMLALDNEGSEEEALAEGEPAR